MKVASIYCLGVLIFSLALTGCSKKEDNREAAKPSASTTAEPAPVPSKSTPGEGVGTITGKVLFKGSYKAGKVAVGKDKEVCGDSKLDPALILGSQGEVKNAVVQIADLKQSKADPKDAVLDQVKCEYVPHVLVVAAGTTVKIKNSDGILHNVHSFSEKNSPFNRAQPKYQKELSEKFIKPEIISLRCDVHGWMTGWVVVTESPHSNVSQADGTFKLETVPAGSYTLEVWHETLGKATQPVTVKPGEVTNVTFEFQLKK